MEDLYNFTFSGEWTDEELGFIQSAVSKIEDFIDIHVGPGKGLEWVTKYLPVRFKHGSLFGNNFVLYGTIYLTPKFGARTVVHEFGHVLDNNIGYARRRERRIFGNHWPRPLDSAIFGKGPSDDLFIAMGGVPKGTRFMNGDNDTAYRNDVGVMKTLPEGARFNHGLYANHCTADYFAETWEAMVMQDDMTKPKAPPSLARNWMANFISTLTV